jgi:hypothetical protein
VITILWELWSPDDKSKSNTHAQQHSTLDDDDEYNDDDDDDNDDDEQHSTLGLKPTPNATHQHRLCISP